MVCRFSRGPKFAFWRFQLFRLSQVWKKKILGGYYDILSLNFRYLPSKLSQGVEIWYVNLVRIINIIFLDVSTIFNLNAPSHYINGAIRVSPNFIQITCSKSNTWRYFYPHFLFHNFQLNILLLYNFLRLIKKCDISTKFFSNSYKTKTTIFDCLVMYLFFPPRLENYLLSLIVTKIDKIWGISFDWRAVWYSGVGMISSQNLIMTFGLKS